MKYFSVATAFTFYCNAKHSDILRGSGYVDCYLFSTKLMRVNSTGNVIHIHYWKKGSGFLEIRIIKFTSRLFIKMPPFHFFMTSLIY